MKTPIEWKTMADGTVSGPGFHDGYFYGAVQEEDRLTLYLKSYDDHSRKIELHGITEMNLTDFWIGSIVGEVWLWPIAEVKSAMWEKLFAGRIANHNREASLQKLINGARSKYFFALESSYGANVYAVCDGMEIAGNT